MKNQIASPKGFLLSCAHYREIPRIHGEEYCLLGRSNVGKSSFINHALKNNRLARVSKTPGKTSLANYYRINESLVWVDMPGYGFAKKARQEKLRWSQLIRDYCEQRENLYGVVWLIDIRHPGASADIQAYEWFRSLRIPVFPVFTKCDKLSQAQRKKNRKEMRKYFPIKHEGVMYSLSLPGCRECFWKEFNIWRGQLSKTSV